MWLRTVIYSINSKQVCNMYGVKEAIGELNIDTEIQINACNWVCKYKYRNCYQYIFS